MSVHKPTTVEPFLAALPISAATPESISTPSKTAITISEESKNLLSASNISFGVGATFCLSLISPFSCVSWLGALDFMASDLDELVNYIKEI